ncbi:substrate-binding domain-containing protein [Arthrobacter sp. B6]|uniref:substrate-binding domain-containing protein n=1 Tax=Arthrobacter sp. B6 TaxID=1570137 RepID=UPI0009EEB4B1|nr:substrate-binding domain-containing protein [Arthrobacter sp. B6]
MNSRRSGRCPLLAILCCLILLAGCSSPSRPDTVRGALIIVGSGAQHTAINTWGNEWSAQYNGASVNFSPDGQDVGIQALLKGNTYVATSDTPLTEHQAAESKKACGAQGAFSIPTSITPIGVAYNLGATRGLKLDAPALAGIFSGSIRKWNDTRIQSLNPAAELPDDEIIPVTPEEPTPLAFAASSYLSKDGEGSWTSPPSREWPLDIPGAKVETEGDIGQEVDDNFGTIAFMKMGDIGTRFNTMSLKFSGEYASLSADPISQAIAQSVVVADPHGVTVTMGSGNGYQLATVNYQVFCSDYKNDTLATLVRSWAEFVVSEPGQTKARIYAGIHSPNEAALEASRELAATIGSVS